MARKIELKSIPMTVPGMDGPQMLSYTEQIVQILRSPVDQNGLSVDDVLAVGPVLLKFQAHSGVKAIVLENAEYDLLMKRLATFRFAFADQAIMTFIIDLRSALKFEVGTEAVPDAEADD